MPTPVIKGFPGIHDVETWGQERHNDPVAYGETSLPGTSMAGHRHKAGLVPRLVRQHPREKSVGEILQNNYNVPNDNNITEVSHTPLRRVTSRILSQRSGHPITPIRFFHGTLPSKSIPGNNHDHGAMVKKCLPPLQLDSSKRP